MITAEQLLGRAVALVLAFALDLLFGDPSNRLHPVAWLGAFISAMDHALRRRPVLDGRAGGALLAAITMTFAAGTAAALSLLAHLVALPLGIIVDAALVWTTLSARSLAEEGRAVASLLEGDDLPAARVQVARVVARRVDRLNEAGVSRATVESLGENVVDGVVAPIFWAVLLGPGGAWLHKVASTLDSMVGYQDERYNRFGFASARLDDVFAWVPARIALLAIPAAATAIRLDGPGAWRIGLRDRRRHASPNSAHGEAAFAGALGVWLGGPAEYADGVYERPVIGEAPVIPGPDDIRSAARLVVASGIVSVAFAVAALVVTALVQGAGTS